MRGIKLSLLGISIILAGIAFSTNHFIAIAAGILGCILAAGALFVKN